MSEHAQKFPGLSRRDRIPVMLSLPVVGYPPRSKPTDYSRNTIPTTRYFEPEFSNWVSCMPWNFHRQRWPLSRPGLKARVCFPLTSLIHSGPRILRLSQLLAFLRVVMKSGLLSSGTTNHCDCDHRQQGPGYASWRRGVRFPETQPPPSVACCLALPPSREIGRCFV